MLQQHYLIMVKKNKNQCKDIILDFMLIRIKKRELLKNKVQVLGRKIKRKLKLRF